MNKTGYLAVLCLSTGLALPATAQTQQSQQPMGQQQLGQQPMGQQQFGQQQFGQQPTGQQKLTEQRIQNFFTQAEDVLQRTARSQDPAQLRQYLDQFLEPDGPSLRDGALYRRPDVATTVAFAMTKPSRMRWAMPRRLQGRKLVSDYNIEISVQDFRSCLGKLRRAS